MVQLNWITTSSSHRYIILQILQMAYETNTVKIARTERTLCPVLAHRIRTRIRPTLKHPFSYFAYVCVCRLQMLISSTMLTYIIASGFACDWNWTRPHLSKILLPIFRVTDSDKIMVLHILAQFLYKPYILLSVRFRYAVVSLWVASLNPTELDDSGSTEPGAGVSWVVKLSLLHVDFWLKFVVNTIY